MLKKRTLALLLSLTMLLSLLTPTALATEGEEQGAQVTEVVEEPTEDEQTPDQNGDAKDDQTDADQPTTGDEAKDEDETKDEPSQDGNQPTTPDQGEEPGDPEQNETETPDESQETEQTQCTCGAAEGEEHAEDCPLYDLAAAYPPISGEASYADVKIIVNAPAGAFPAGTYLSVTPVVVEKDRMLESIQTALENTPFDTLEEGEEPFSVDIAFKTPDGVELQPREGYPVDVRFELPSEQLTADTMQVFHVSEGEDGLKADLVDVVSVEAAEPVPQTQTVELAATSFSIYAVTSETSTNRSTSIRANDTFNMKVNAPLGNASNTSGITYFFWTNTRRNGGAQTGEDYRYTWTVEDPGKTIDWEIYSYSTNDKADLRRFPWIKVTALQPTGSNQKAKITLTYRQYGSDSDHTETFYVNVLPADFYIKDTIADDGCLTATDTSGKAVTYTWLRDDQADTINKDALNDSKVNVAIDRGGIDTNGVAKTYTVYGYDADGKEVGHASFEVPYGNEVLNGSFEQPNTNGRHAIVVANGYSGVYWKTTAPGAGEHLGQDIEILRPENDYKGEKEKELGVYGTPAAADDGGKQAAELNAEDAGALYQDVLTAPGATLTWNLSHRARYMSNYNKESYSYWDDDHKMTREQVEDTMYVVIASTAQASSYNSQVALNKIIADAENKGLTTDNSVQSTLSAWNDRANNTSGPEITYQIWKLTSDATDWHKYSDTYQVPTGQYLTRFFFAAGQTCWQSYKDDNATNMTVGNLIDGVSFNSEMNYTIEYYLDDETTPYFTESGSADPFETIRANKTKMDELAQDAALVRTTLNGKEYGGDSFTLTMDSNVLRLYYKRNTISVTKIVSINGWDSLRPEDRAVIWPENYTAVFALMENGTKVAETTVSVPMDSLNGVGKFEYTPSAGKTYTIVELAASELTGYSCTGTSVTPEDGVMLTTGKLSASFTVTNTYDIANLDLTIVKEGWQPIDENQSFIFNVKGDDVDMDVTINFSDVDKATRSVTITGLKPGSYTVTEKTDWSWRYTPDQGTKNITLTVSGDNTVTFNNTRKTPGKWLNGCSWAVNNWNKSTPTRSPATPGSAN